MLTGIPHSVQESANQMKHVQSRRTPLSVCADNVTAHADSFFRVIVSFAFLATDSMNSVQSPSTLFVDIRLAVRQEDTPIYGQTADVYALNHIIKNG